ARTGQVVGHLERDKDQRLEDVAHATLLQRGDALLHRGRERPEVGGIGLAAQAQRLAEQCEVDTRGVTHKLASHGGAPAPRRAAARTAITTAPDPAWRCRAGPRPSE